MKNLTSPAVTWVPIQELIPHPEAQRPFDNDWAKELADTFDPDKFGVVTVLQVGQRLYVVDGAHRVAAARLALGENQKLPCQVYDVDGANGKAKAADLFLGHNDRRGLKAIDVFRNRVARGDEGPVTITKILRSRGLRVESGPDVKNVQAVSACERVYRQSPMLFADVVRILSEVWRDDPIAFHALIIKGLALALTWNPDLKAAEVSAKLRAVTQAEDLSAASILARGRALRESGQVGAVPTGVADALLAIWNKGRRSGRAVLSSSRR